MKNIPLIIPVFNQLTYLKNLINWWKWYHPENPVIIVDNGSTYPPLVKYLTSLMYDDYGIVVHPYSENNFIKNLNKTIESLSIHYDYYVISDPDIMPHPSTPGNFLEVMKSFIDEKGYHHCGFNLITKDLPENLNERQMIIDNELELTSHPSRLIEILPSGYGAVRAPLDTTFCLYKASDGWEAPMDGQKWDQCVRVFSAFHLGWHIDQDHLNEEMEYYFKTSKYRVPGEPSAGKNNNRPQKFQ